ncbi:phosphatidylglycerophosphatase and protein-tyrosine phosphatase 1 isoform X1 [Arapaima gigas]
MSGALARLLFYPTLGYNVVMEKVSSRRWFNRVDQTVILGALPFKSMTDELVHRENVRGIVTMNEEYETKYFCNSAEEWAAAGVEQLRLSTVDLTGVPTLGNLHRGVEFVLQHKEQGTSVYVHCKAGRSRSATMVAAYLIRVSAALLTSDPQKPLLQSGLIWSFLSCPQLHCWSPEEACQALKSIRPHVLIHSAQMEILHQYHREVCSS